MKKTKGQVEAEIGNALIQFEKDYMGRGPQETKTFIIEDMILIRLKGVLTAAEQQLAKNPEGMNLIKMVRSNLLEQGRDLLTDVIEKITGLKVVTLHTDISTKTGERMIVFTLNKNLELLFRTQEAKLISKKGT
ncbi:MAG: Na-translocating system protein MpsC family protein [Leptospirillum sp.]|jgi:uncharacterized protein YbcI|nr:DUF2294 domain-containing protein [Nitrospiraceae bacterium]